MSAQTLDSLISDALSIRVATIKVAMPSPPLATAAASTSRSTPGFSLSDPFAASPAPTPTPTPTPPPPMTAYSRLQARRTGLPYNPGAMYGTGATPSPYGAAPPNPWGGASPSPTPTPTPPPSTDPRARMTSWAGSEQSRLTNAFTTGQIDEPTFRRHLDEIRRRQSDFDARSRTAMGAVHGLHTEGPTPPPVEEPNLFQRVFGLGLGAPTGGLAGLGAGLGAGATGGMTRFASYITKEAIDPEMLKQIMRDPLFGEIAQKMYGHLGAKGMLAGGRDQSVLREWAERQLLRSQAREAVPEPVGAARTRDSQTSNQGQQQQRSRTPAQLLGGAAAAASPEAGTGIPAPAGSSLLGRRRLGTPAQLLGGASAAASPEAGTGIPSRTPPPHPSTLPPPHPSLARVTPPPHPSQVQRPIPRPQGMVRRASVDLTRLIQDVLPKSALVGSFLKRASDRGVDGQTLLAMVKASCALHPDIKSEFEKSGALPLLLGLLGLGLGAAGTGYGIYSGERANRQAEAAAAEARAVQERMEAEQRRITETAEAQRRMQQEEEARQRGYQEQATQLGQLASSGNSAGFGRFLDQHFALGGNSREGDPRMQSQREALQAMFDNPELRSNLGNSANANAILGSFRDQATSHIRSQSSDPLQASTLYSTALNQIQPGMANQYAWPTPAATSAGGTARSPGLPMGGNASGATVGDWMGQPGQQQDSTTAGPLGLAPLGNSAAGAGGQPYPAAGQPGHAMLMANTAPSAPANTQSTPAMANATANQGRMQAATGQAQTAQRAQGPGQGQGMTRMASAEGGPVVLLPSLIFPKAANAPIRMTPPPLPTARMLPPPIRTTPPPPTAQMLRQPSLSTMRPGMSGRPGMTSSLVRPTSSLPRPVTSGQTPRPATQSQAPRPAPAPAPTPAPTGGNQWPSMTGSSGNNQQAPKPGVLSRAGNAFSTAAGGLGGVGMGYMGLDALFDLSGSRQDARDMRNDQQRVRAEQTVGEEAARVSTLNNPEEVETFVRGQPQNMQGALRLMMNNPTFRSQLSNAGQSSQLLAQMRRLAERGMSDQDLARVMANQLAPGAADEIFASPTPTATGPAGRAPAGPPGLAPGTGMERRAMFSPSLLSADKIQSLQSILQRHGPGLLRAFGPQAEATLQSLGQRATPALARAGSAMGNLGQTMTNAGQTLQGAGPTRAAADPTMTKTPPTPGPSSSAQTLELRSDAPPAATRTLENRLGEPGGGIDLASLGGQSGGQMNVPSGMTHAAAAVKGGGASVAKPFRLAELL